MIHGVSWEFATLTTALLLVGSVGVWSVTPEWKGTTMYTEPTFTTLNCTFLSLRWNLCCKDVT